MQGALTRLLEKTVARKTVAREHSGFLRDSFLRDRGEAPFVGAGTLLPSTAAAGFSHGFQLQLADSPLPPHHGYRALHKLPAVAALFCSSPRSRRRCVREVLGNAFGLASALGGMRRKVWAWPVGILGNLLLLTVFLGALVGSPHPVTMLGQAGRQIMFIAVSIWGWHRWRATRTAGGDASEGAAVIPKWATNTERAGLVVAMVAGTLLLTPIFRALGSYEPVWSDAWIFTGSLLATYGMARGWVEFWLIWVAVDLVGVPLLWSAGYYATSLMYVFYGCFTLVGFFVWWRTRNLEVQKARVQTQFPDVTVDVADLASADSVAECEVATKSNTAQNVASQNVAS